MHDEVFPERDDEKDAEESGTCGEGKEPANVLYWIVGQKLETVHGRNGTDEQDSQASRS